MASASRALCVLLLTALAVFGQAVAARPLAEEPTQLQQVQRALEDLTTLSNDLRMVVDNITEENVETKGVLLPQGLDGINDKLTKADFRFCSLNAEHKLKPFGDADAKLVVEAVKTFVNTYDAMLTAATDKFMFDIRSYRPTLLNKSVFQSLNTAFDLIDYFSNRT